MSELAWVARARSYLGMREVPGPKHHPTILRWLEKIKAPFREDESAWCGSGLAGIFEECGLSYPKNPWGARNWLNFGKKLSRPAYGCVVVFWRGKPSGWSGHVGLVVGKDKRGNLMVLGCNQGNAVSIAPFPMSRVLGYRWPSIRPHADRYNLPILNSDGKVSQNEA